jgi:hypothetical protein
VRRSPVEYERALVVRLLAVSAVDPVVVTEGLGAVVGAVGSPDDCTRPGRIHPAEGNRPVEGIQLVDSLPGIREKKRRTRQLAEAWVLREGLQALGIARRWVSQVLYLLTHCARASMRWGRT